MYDSVFPLWLRGCAGWRCEVMWSQRRCRSRANNEGLDSILVRVYRYSTGSCTAVCNVLLCDFEARLKISRNEVVGCFHDAPGTDEDAVKSLG